MDDNPVLPEPTESNEPEASPQGFEPPAMEGETDPKGFVNTSGLGEPAPSDENPSPTLAEPPVTILPPKPIQPPAPLRRVPAVEPRETLAGAERVELPQPSERDPVSSRNRVTTPPAPPVESEHKKKKKDKGKKKRAAAELSVEAVPFERETEPQEQVKWLKKKFYEKELRRLQYELVKMQYWIRDTGQRVILLFEGRDAAGKGGVTQRILQPLNPRGVRLVALGKPSDVERSQWFFQRYVAHLPSAGEIVIFDRSWYNRGVVERVLGFCSDKEYWEFLYSCPDFERMLVRSGIILLKYWLSVSDAEQERRFQDRAADPTRRWKLSPVDIASRDKWVQFSKAKDIMFEHTDIPEARWYQIEADDKRRARVNCIRHILSTIPYQDVTPEPIDLPPRPPADEHYSRPPRERHLHVPDYYGDRDK